MELLGSTVSYACDSIYVVWLCRCPKNTLGDREKPLKKAKKKKEGKGGGEEEEEWQEEGELEEDFSLGDAIKYAQEMKEREVGSTPTPCAVPCERPSTSTARRTIQPSSYFSDEDASD